MTFARSKPPSFTPDELLLAHQVASYVAIVTNNALLYQAAQEADRNKDEFLATLAHELRNPLAAIVMAVGLLRTRGDAAGVQKSAAIIDRQGARLVRLVDDLLDVSRLARGRITMQTEPVLLGEIINNAVDPFSRRFNRGSTR